MTEHDGGGGPPVETLTVTIDEAELTVARWGDGPIEIVLLHDGLGSITQWRGVPARLARATGRAVLAYDRPGHGASTPVPDGPWPADWLHREADRFGRLLDELDVLDELDAAAAKPLVVGHSDGGSIALLHAAATGGSGLRGVVTLAPHIWVEQVCVDAIVGMRRNWEPIVAGLASHHRCPEAIFEAWSGVWVGADFRPWDIRDRLATIECPVTVAQGRLDEYASEAHAGETALAIGGNARSVLLDGVGHLLHHQDPDLVVRLIAQAVDESGK